MTFAILTGGIRQENVGDLKSLDVTDYCLDPRLDFRFLKAGDHDFFAE